MDDFLEQAARIWQTAMSAEGGDDWTILVGPDGGLRLQPTEDSLLSSIAEAHGSRLAYRVTRRAGMVRVEAQDGARRCVIESGAFRRAPASLTSAPAAYPVRDYSISSCERMLPT